MKYLRKSIQIILAVTLMLVLAPYVPAKAEGEGTESYGLWVGEVEVTSGNKDDILEDGGKAKYDPDTGTLTLADPALGTGLKNAIYAENLNLIIQGDVNLNATKHGIYVKGGSLTIEEGNITVNVKGEDNVSGLRAGTGLNIKGGTINITAESTGGILCNASGLRGENVNISGGKVDVNVIYSYHSRGIDVNTKISGGDTTLKSK